MTTLIQLLARTGRISLQSLPQSTKVMWKTVVGQTKREGEYWGPSDEKQVGTFTTAS